MTSTSSNNPYHISTLIEKMNNLDKDFRFMAINDLISELQNDSLRLDSDSERKLTKEVLRLLEDQNLEVQNQAVKCLSYLVRKIKEPNIINVIKELTQKMTQINNDTMCGICAIGLKTIVTDTPMTENTVIAIIVKEVPKPLIELMSQNESGGLRQMEAFDIMSEVIIRLGMRLPPYDLKAVFSACQYQLFNDRPSVRKRAIACIGSLICVTGSEYFDEFLTYLIERLSPPDPKKIKQEDLKTLIQCIGVLTKQPARTGLYIYKVYPILQNLIGYNEEIQDLVIQTLEALISKCSVEMSQYIEKVVTILLKLISYDPNYHYDEDEDMDSCEEVEEDENEEFLYSDDEDQSWKVRRSAAKCLETCLITYPELINEFIKMAAPILIDRFNEREETVKREIFQCFLTLLKQTGNYSRMIRTRSTHDVSPYKQMMLRIPSMLDKLRKQAKSKNWIVRQGIFAILKEATVAVPNCFGFSIGTVINVALITLHDSSSNSNLKFDAVNLLVELISSNPDSDFSEHFTSLTKVALVFINDSFYRLSLESLDLALVLITKARKFNTVNTILQIYGPLYSILQTANTDFDLKEKSINTMSALCCCLGDYLSPGQVEQCLKIFIDRLNNELIRVNVLRAFISLSRAVDVINLENYIPAIVNTITPFLMKNDRLLRLETLKCFESFWMNYESKLKNATSTILEIINVLPPLINDTDLQIAQNTIVLCNMFLKTNNPEVKSSFWHCLMSPILDLLKSPLLHGSTLQALVSLMKIISSMELFDVKIITSQLLTSTISDVNIDCINREAYPNISSCVAELIINVNSNSKREEYIEEFYQTSLVNHKTECSSHQYLSMMILGDIGRSVDMSQRKYVLDAIMNVFNCGNEILKSASAYSLGKMALCRLDIFVPYILNQIEQHPNYQYFLLHSLREIILALGVNEELKYSDLSVHFNIIWDLLLDNSNSPEEGIRNIVGECIGKLALMDPPNIIPKLREIVSSVDGRYLSYPLTRATIVTAIKYTIVADEHPIDSFLITYINEFLVCLKDTDLAVQRAGLITLNTIVHNKPDIIRGTLDPSTDVQSDNILGWLYAATRVRPELIREVEMGPFKHLEDDGLDLRKCAFECISSLLDNCLDRINVLLFVDRIEEGLRDNGEIKLLCYPMLSKIAKHCPTKFLDKFTTLIPAIRSLLTSKSKQDAVKQEQEKLDEQKRAAIKFLVHVSFNENLNKSKPFTELMNSVVNGPLHKMFVVEHEFATQKQRF